MNFLTLSIVMMSLSVSKSSRLISIIKGGKKGTSSNELRGSGTTLNEVRASEDSYSVYQAMMMNVLGSHEPGEDKSDDVTKPPTVRMEMSTETSSTPKVIQTMKDAFSVLLEVAVKGIFEGLMPHVERQRREAVDERRTYIDLVINFLGALLGRQQCSQILACR